MNECATGTWRAGTLSPFQLSLGRGVHSGHEGYVPHHQLEICSVRRRGSLGDKECDALQEPAERGSWYEDLVQPSTEFYFDLKALALQSPLADAVLCMEPSAVAMRFVSEFRRGADVVRLSDWIIADRPDVRSMSGRVDSIAQITYTDSSASYIRLWCTQSRGVTVADDFTQWSAGRPANMLVELEATQVRVVTCSVDGHRYVFS